MVYHILFTFRLKLRQLALLSRPCLQNRLSLFPIFISHSFLAIQTEMHSLTLILGFTSVLSRLPRSLAALPYQVYNVTAVEPPSLVPETVELTVAEVYTTTVITTATITSATTATTTAAIVETTTLPPPPPPVSKLTVIYPSSDAAPVEVTATSQVITSYIPEATFCVGPALYFSSISGGPFTNGSANVTQYISGTTRCSVAYSTTTKTICATTLTGLASKITVSECEQQITFSSECGYTLETPSPTSNADSLITPAPTVRRLMTYWLAPWQSLIAGSTPSDVDVKVCTELDSGDMECQRYQEVWEVFVVTSTLTNAYPVTFSQTLEGPGALIIDESTSFVNSTTEVIDLSRTLRLVTEITVEATRTSMRPWSTVRSTQQHTSTLTVTRRLKLVASR